MGRAGLRGRERRERSESKLAMCLHVFWSARELESCTCVLWRLDDTCVAYPHCAFGGRRRVALAARVCPPTPHTTASQRRAWRVASGPSCSAVPVAGLGRPRGAFTSHRPWGELM